MFSEQSKKQKILKLVLLLVFLAVVVLILSLIPKLSPQTLRDYFQAKGSAAAIYYILAFAILPAFFFPVAPLAVASGLAFSFWHGLLYTIIGAVLNSTLTFWISRSLAQERFHALIIKHDSRGWVKKYLQSGQTKSYYVLLLLRLVPAVPFTLLNYASGLGQIAYSPYLLATLAGILPGTMVMVNLGDKVLDTGSPQFFLSLVLILALVAVGILAAKRIAPDLDKDDLRKKLRRKVGASPQEGNLDKAGASSPAEKHGQQEMAEPEVGRQEAVSPEDNTGSSADSSANPDTDDQES